MPPGNHKPASYSDGWVWLPFIQPAVLIRESHDLTSSTQPTTIYPLLSIDVPSIELVSSSRATSGRSEIEFGLEVAGSCCVSFSARAVPVILRDAMAVVHVPWVESRTNCCFCPQHKLKGYFKKLVQLQTKTKSANQLGKRLEWHVSALQLSCRQRQFVTWALRPGNRKPDNATLGLSPREYHENVPWITTVYLKQTQVLNDKRMSRDVNFQYQNIKYYLFWIPNRVN